MMVLIALWALWITQSAQAYEIDNFHERDSMKDCRVTLNEKTNKELSKALNEANEALKRRGESCKPLKFGQPPVPELYDAIRRRLGGGVVGALESWATDAAEIDKRSPEKSVYDAPEGLSSGAGFMLSLAGLEPIVNLKGHPVGVDKFGHFFDQGFEYFESYLMERKPLEDALKAGIKMEEGWFGLNATGIKSYGDLGANFSGMQFWLSVEMGSPPLVRCKGGKYVMNRKFDWADWVNASWDEGMNCSEYKPALKAVVTENLRRSSRECPLDRKSCERLHSLPCADYFVTKSCVPPSRASGPASPGCSLDLLGYPQLEPGSEPCTPPSQVSGAVPILSDEIREMLESPGL